MQDSKTILAFDLGNVIFHFDYNLALDKIKTRLGVSTETIIKEFYDNDFCIPFEKGLVSGHSFYSKFKEKFSADLSYDDFVDIWCEIFWPNPEVFDLIEKLSRNLPVYLISNINQLHFDYLFKKYQFFFSFFKDLILSYKVKYVKPEFGIYQELKKRSGADFRNIVYIDDRQDLVKAAGGFGLECIRFIGFEQLIRDLKRFGISI